MADKKIRGLTSEQELNEEFLFRDTRSFPKKISDWLHKPNNMVMLFTMVMAAVFFMPSISEILFLLTIPIFRWAMRRPEKAPIKIPIQSGIKDGNQPHPATGAPTRGEGIMFLGNELKTGKEVWLTNSDARQHFLVVGTTGAGKTESLLGFAANALMWGSGFLFCDGKGDVALFGKVSALARRFGREDDLLVLNFMTGNQDLGAAGGKILSNTLNPFATGSSDSLTQMIVSLMDDAGGDGAMWKGRATAMLTGVIRALSCLRDEGKIDLNVGEIREFMSLKRIVDLSDESKFPEMPADIRKTIKSYLTSLPGFQEEKGYKQAQTTLDQHGYLEMQFTKILGSLADVYGHIFFTPYGEVDMFDVVLNRRILIIMLPALEKSGDEIANLGKIVVATLKGMMGATLGASLEGTWAEVIENRPTNSPSPFICILDEVGYYTVEGMALMAAQARSLGFSMIYASQDIPAMKRLNEKEAASIIANTNTKIFMRSEEADVTGKLAVDSAGKGLRAQVGGFSGTSGELGLKYTDSMEARLETSDRVNFTDLKSQTEGSMHILFQDKVVRAKSFYANPEGAIDKNAIALRANHFIKVAKPDYEEMERARRLPKITAELTDPEKIDERIAEANRSANAPSTDDEIGQVVNVMRNLSGKQKLLDVAACAVGSVIHSENESIAEFHKAIFDANGGVPEQSSGPLKVELEDDILDAAMAEMQQEEAEKPAPKKLINKKIHHDVAIEGDEDNPENDLINMGDDLHRNDAIMRALASVDYGDDTDNEAAERKFSQALDPTAFMMDDDMDAPELKASDVEDAVAASADSVFDDINGLEAANYSEDDRDPSDDDDDDEDGDDGFEMDGGDITTELLSQLMMDDDDD